MDIRVSRPGLAAIDVGSLLVRVAVSRGDGELELRAESAGGGGQDGLRSALAAVRRRGGADTPVCVAVPDSWLDGGADGARCQEELRHIAEDEFGLTAVTWAGQLASAAALAASGAPARGATPGLPGPPSGPPGRYLVGDVGGAGVRVALCAVEGRTVRQVAVYDEPGGGWRDFDAAVRAAAGADSGLDGWDESAMAQEKRARLVFERARTAPEFRGARAYSLTGADGTFELTAGQAMDCFAPAAERIRAGAEAVGGTGTTDGGSPTAAVLVGGLGWFPLAAVALADAVGRDPVVLGPDAVARGALLIAAGSFSAAPRGLPTVSLPMHQVRDGLLEQADIRLPWEAQFASADGEPLTLAGPEITLDIGGRRTELEVPGLTAGEYRVGVRPSWSGSAVIVLRADRAGRGPDIHVAPLDLQEMPDE